MLLMLPLLPTLLALGCSKPLPQGVLLVTIDTWRADHLSEAAAPNAWAIAEKGARYTDAWSPIGLTTPAHASLMTGLTPPQHGMRGNNHHGYGLDERFTTAAELFAAAGWDTAAFVSAYPAGPEGGLTQGFATVDAPADGERDTAEAVTAALAWMESREEPWFLWVHAYDPHGPYVPAAEDLEALGGSGTTTADATRYAAEVHAADRVLGPLYKRALKGGASLVITSDHGEVHSEESCGWQHERSSSEVVLRVPLVLAGPDVPQREDDARVTLMDVFPTLLKLGGVTDPGGHNGYALPRPSRVVAIGESGMCDSNCSPGCKPYGHAGKDRVVYSKKGPSWLERPGRDPVGDPTYESYLSDWPAAEPPPKAPSAEDIKKGKALGYTE